MDADIGDDRVHPDAVRLPAGLPDGIRGVHGVEELAVLEHLRPDALVDAAAEVLDELAIDVLRHRRQCFRRLDRYLRFQGPSRKEFELYVIEPGRAGGLPPAAENAVERKDVVGPAFEDELHPGPVLRSGDGLAPDIGAVEAEKRAPDRPPLGGLGFNPA